MEQKTETRKAKAEAVKKSEGAKPKTEHQKQKAGKDSYNPWNILRYIHMAEKSMNMVEKENKVTFIVNRKSDRGSVKRAVEAAFNVKVLSVNIENTQKGEKKAYVKLSPESRAIDIATKMGMI